jgi:tetratricopeptide (TPR) repeat protein
LTEPERAILVLNAQGSRYYTLHANGRLARALEEQDQLSRAEEIWRSSIEQHRELLGDRHTSTASAYSNLAFVLLRMKRYNEAQAAFTISLSIFTDKFGERHIITFPDREGLGRALLADGNPAAALREFRKAAAILMELSAKARTDRAAADEFERRKGVFEHRVAAVWAVAHPQR